MCREKNKNGSGKPKIETPVTEGGRDDDNDDDDDDEDENEDEDDGSNESISGSRPKTFEEGNSRIFNFLPTFSAPQVKTRARCCAANWEVFLPFLSSSPEIAALYEATGVQIRFCFRSISSFGRSPEEQSRMSRGLKRNGTERNMVVLR